MTARSALEENEKKFGFVPTSLARMAICPAVLEAALRGLPIFERSSRRFVHEGLDRTGDPTEALWSEFLAAGCEPAQALEIAQGIAAYALTTFANRLTESPLD